MLTFTYVEINLFALTILLLIFINIHRRSEKYMMEQKLYVALLGANALILIFDTLMWLMDGKNGYLLRESYLLVAAVYYTLNPAICLLWSFYADYQINRSKKHLRKLILPLSIPAGVNAILSFASMFGGYLFFIDEYNIYYRGPLFGLMASISFAYLVYTFIKIIQKQKKIKKQKFIPILFFAIPPFLGGIIQTFCYGVSLIWICTTISLLIIFINIQDRQLYTDYLTGLFNRRQLDYYLQQRFQSVNNESKLLSGIMIDLDSFKMINDMYGHYAGDQALEYTAKILKKTFRKDDFVARYGGDEFIVIMEIKDVNDLYKAVERLKENIALFNKQKLTPYTINLSIGYDIFEGASEESVTEFLKRIDSLMYKDKLSKPLNKLA